MVLEITATHEQERLIKEMLAAMSITFNNSDNDSSIFASHSFEVGQDGSQLEQSLKDCLGIWKDNQYQDFAEFRKAAWGNRGLK